MLRKECVPSEGLHQDDRELGSEASEHAPGLAISGSPELTITPVGGGAGGGDTLESGPHTTSSTPTHGENLSDLAVTSELDPHICRQWPCPQCHKPRDFQDDPDEIPGGQYSAEALRPSTATTQSFFHPQAAAEPLKMEQSESDDDL